MPRSSPTKRGLGVRESRNGHLSNIRVSDLPFLALYDAMCFNLPNHPSVSNIKQAFLLESGKLCKRNCVLSSVTQLEEPGVFNRVVLCMMEQLKLCSRRIHTGYEKVQYLLDLHVGLKCLFLFFLITKTKHQAYEISKKILFLYPNCRSSNMISDT